MDKLLEICYKAMDDRQANNLVILDFRKHSPYIDYFIIGDCRNERMAFSILDEIEERAIEAGYPVKYVDKTRDSKWKLIDLGSVVCHVFYDGEREVYNLEGLWKDLETVQM